MGNACTPTASAIASNDLMFGNGGSDKLCDWQGNDILSGGMGRDRFVLTAGSGPNLITDLTKGEDLLVLASGLTFAQLSITQNANAAFMQNAALAD